jgi:hypothetical protein
LGWFLVKGAPTLQSFQSRCGSLHQRIRIETGPMRGRVHAPSATGATPLVFFVPGLAMDALHISSVFIKRPYPRLLQ